MKSAIDNGLQVTLFKWYDYVSLNGSALLEKGKKLGQLESGSQKDGLTEGNACGHCSEALAKLTELIAGLDKLLDLI